MLDPQHERDQLERIKDRYFRRSTNQPEGRLGHFGDCWIYACGICNCGLISDLMILEKPDSHYPNYYEELAKMNRRRDILFEIAHINPQYLEVPEITPEEKAELDKMLEDLFGHKDA